MTERAGGGRGDEMKGDDGARWYCNVEERETLYISCIVLSLVSA